MNALVIFDSKFGNTERVAERVGAVLGAQAIHVSQARPELIAGLDLLVLGSPTQGGRPTQVIKDFLKQLPADALKGVRVAAFDTRIDSKAHGPFFRLVTGVIGYAAGRMNSSMEARGGISATHPEGFIVEDTEGPLGTGEEQRASAWATHLAEFSRTA
jgi:flavodoxin